MNGPLDPTEGMGRAYEKPRYSPGFVPVRSAGKLLSLLARPLGTFVGLLNTSLLGHKEYILRQLGDVASAGLPLAPALEALEQDVNHRLVRNDLAIMRKAIEEGRPLSEAMVSGTILFNRLDSVLARVGETTGRLPAMLSLAESLVNHRRRMRSFMKSLLLYPGVIFVFLLFFCLWRLVFLGPKMDWIGAHMGASAASPSHSVGDALFLKYAPLIGLGACLLIALLRRTAPALGQWKFRVPVLGGIWRAASATVFLHALTQCLKAGISSGETIGLSFEATDDRAFMRHASNAVGSVEAGKPIVAVLEEARVLPGETLALLQLGDKSGRLIEAVEEARDLMGDRFTTRVRWLTTCAEPGILLVIAIPVAWFAIETFGFLAAVLNAWAGGSP